MSVGNVHGPNEPKPKPVADVILLVAGSIVSSRSPGPLKLEPYNCALAGVTKSPTIARTYAAMAMAVARWSGRAKVLRFMTVTPSPQPRRARARQPAATQPNL